MKNDYVPKSDSEFLTWARNFSNYFADNAVSMGFTAADATAITDDVSSFESDFQRHVTAQDTARSVRQAKDERRDTTESDIRAMARRLQAAPSVSDEQRQAMGLPVHDRARSLAMAPELHRPFGIVDTSAPFRHVINYRDEMTPDSRARPDMAIGCEVWMKILSAGEPVPVNPDSLTYAGTNSATPFICEFEGADANKVAHYRLRWVSRDGTKGPWGETLSATIVG